jgi:rhomboid protease GluP
MTNSQKLRSSMICPGCRKLISADEPVCPHCGLSGPGSRWKTSLRIADFLPGDDMVRWIIYANVTFYVISLLFNPSRNSITINPLNFLSPNMQTLLLLGGTGTVPIDRFHRWWTLLSANYLHGGALHILFNMMALKHIGPFIVREYGVHRMVTIFTLGGVLGFFLSYLAGVPFSIGASAAVCSLIGAALYYGKTRAGPYGHAVYRQVMGWVVGLFLFGFLVPGINNWAHGGGIGAGILLGVLLGYQEQKRENAFHKTIASICIVATVGVLLWAVSSALYLRFAV